MSETDPLPTPDTSIPPPEGSRWGRAHHVMLLVGGLLLVIWLLTGFYVVGANEVAIVERLGQYEPVVNRGLNYGFPWPIDNVHKIPTSQTLTVELTDFSDVADPAVEDFKRQLISDPDNRLNQQNLNAVFNPYLITGDKNMINAKLSIYFRIDDPMLYLTGVYQPEGTGEDMRYEMIRKSAARALIRTLGMMKVDDALYDQRPELVSQVKEGLQQECNNLKLGILITTVTVDVRPPPFVDADFSAVAKNKQEASRLEEAAQSKANSTLAEAKGEAASVLAQAQGYEKSVVAAAMGQKARFEAIQAQYANAKLITTQSLYGDAMAKVLQNVTRIYLVQPGQKITIILTPPSKPPLLGSNGGQPPGSPGGNPGQAP